MTAFNTPPGFTVVEDEFSIGAPGVLLAHPDASTSFQFVSPMGVTILEQGVGTAATTLPTLGQLWPSGVLNPVTSTSDRATKSFTTNVLTPGTSTAASFILAKSYRLLNVTTDRPARVRLYTTPEKRDADAARLLGVYPTGDHGLVLEATTSPTMLSIDLTPTVDGFDGKPSPDGIIAYHVTNYDGTNSAVTTTLKYIRTE